MYFFKLIKILLITFILLLTIIKPAFADVNKNNNAKTNNLVHLDISVGQFITNSSTKNQGNLFSTSLKLTDVINKKFSVFTDFSENAFNRSQSNWLNAGNYNGTTYDFGAIYKFDDRTWLTFSGGTSFRINALPNQIFTNKFIGVSLTHRVF